MENNFEYPDQEENISEKSDNFWEYGIRKRDEEILKEFTPEEQEIIKEKREKLSVLCYYIGKDFKIPVELNLPGEGWHWDFEKNIVRIDPQDLLEMSMEYLRYVISHEGGHRRVSRTEFIPNEEWQESGFSFLMNAIEDPRTNNFIAENYPVFKEQMQVAVEYDLDIEEKQRKKAVEKLGYQPLFMQAGFEYIRQWFNDAQEKEIKITEELPEEVKEVLEKTVSSAQKSWWTYPSKKQADSGEVDILKFARSSYQINRNEIWPEFKKLVEIDKKNQQTQELLQEMQKNQGDSQIPKELSEELTEEEKEKLIEELEKALQEKEEGVDEEKEDSEKKGKPINLDFLPEELKKKIKEYIENLPEDKKKELQEKADDSIKEFSEEVARDLEGKLNQKEEELEDENKENKDEKDVTIKKDNKTTEDYRKKVEKILEKESEDRYREQRKELLPLIKDLEHKLRRLFVARKHGDWQSGHRKGRRIDIGKRIQEKAQEIPATESKAWKKRTVPTESDYAISLLVDLSGSMNGAKIEETLKSVIIVAEVLNKLSIKNEILGFNDRMYEYKTFSERDISKAREKIMKMLDEVKSSRALYNDDGWALKETSERLSRQREKEKFLLVFSDGHPEESSEHSGEEYELSKIVEEVIEKTDNKLIGLGVGPNTKHVEDYYPHHVADIPVEQIPNELSGILRELIENYKKFK